MAEQEGTSGLVRAFLPGLVLGILIGTATTLTYVSFNERNTQPKNPTANPPSNSASTPREIGQTRPQSSPEQDESNQDPGRTGTGDDQAPPPDPA